MTNPKSTGIITPNRRGFLKGLGALGAGSLLCSQKAIAGPAQYAHRFQLSAAGTVTDLSLVWPAPQVPPLPPGTILRVRVEFPIGGHDILEWQTFVAPENAPDQAVFMITLFHMRVDRIGLSETPAPHFGLFGQIIDNPVVDNPDHSPFGDLTGRVAMGYAEFDAPGDNTTFTLLGGAVAGNHASAVRTASGSLNILGPWQSF
jgi:hypothetical protein